MTIRPLERTYDNAPDFVQHAGGVVMSLWMMGAHKLDIQIVAEMKQQRDRYRACLERIAREESGLWGVWATDALKAEEREP